jgi:hypothetical protein
MEDESDGGWRFKALGVELLRGSSGGQVFVQLSLFQPDVGLNQIFIEGFGRDWTMGGWYVPSTTSGMKE